MAEPPEGTRETPQPMPDARSFIDRGGSTSTGATPDAPPVSIDEETRRIARTFAPDLYLSALLAPAPAKPPLITLAAFAGDIDRIVLTVGEPNLAEIRLQWWRDALAAGIASETRTGNPVADAVIATARHHALRFADLDRALDARSLDLYANPLRDEAELDAYIDATVGTACRMALTVLANSRLAPAQTQPRSGRLIDATAKAYGRALLLSRTAAYLARGRSPFDGDVPRSDEALQLLIGQRSAEICALYETARQEWRSATVSERLACLHLSLVPAYLQAATTLGPGLRSQLAPVNPLTRVWSLWRARRIGLPPARGNTRRASA